MIHTLINLWKVDLNHKMAYTREVILSIYTSMVLLSTHDDPYAMFSSAMAMDKMAVHLEAHMPSK